MDNPFGFLNPTVLIDLLWWMRERGHTKKYWWDV